MAASTSAPAAAAPTLLLKAAVPIGPEPTLAAPRRGYPPGERRPVYLSISVLRI